MFSVLKNPLTSLNLSNLLFIYFSMFVIANVTCFLINIDSPNKIFIADY